MNTASLLVFTDSIHFIDHSCSQRFVLCVNAAVYDGYKHAISTVMPAAPVQLWEGEEEEQAEVAAEADTDA